jgi:hypothetical protein
MITFGSPLTIRPKFLARHQAGREFSPALFDENEELDLVAELLKVNSELKLDQFLRNLIHKAGNALGGSVHPTAGQAIGSTLKSVAKRALRLDGRSLGACLGTPDGGGLANAMAPVADQSLGLQAESLSSGDCEFQAALQFVRFAGKTLETALQAAPNARPEAVARAAAAEGMRMYPSGSFNGAFWDGRNRFEGELEFRRPRGAAAPQHAAKSGIAITDVNPPEERLAACTYPSPPDYHVPPAELLADSKKDIVANDGRVNPLIRLHAQMRDPRMILANAVMAHLSSPVLYGGVIKFPLIVPPKYAPALAQLAVTGREAFSKFSSWHPQTPDLIKQVQQAYPNRKLNPSALQSAASAMLDVAYSTLWAVRGNDATWRAYRSKLGWIAASGEDDLPHRPVNVYTAPYPQYDVPVGINGAAVMARYMLASAVTFLSPNVPPAAPAPGKLRSIPSDRPNIPAQNKIILYIHGHGSRLEEAVLLANELIKAGSRKGQTYTVISLDLLNSGYGSAIDWSQLQIGDLSYHPGGDSKKPILGNLTYGCPVLDTEEQFILNFMDALDQQIGNVKTRVAAVIGGSLGGLMSLRLSRRDMVACMCLGLQLV